MKLNDWEKNFKEVIEEAEAWVGNGKELEVVHWFNPKDGESGYYAYEYDGNQSVPIYANDYDRKPLISDETVAKHNVDVIKVLNACNVYYCEC